MNQFGRRIIGFAVHAGDCDGAAYCRMFNSIISSYPALPKYLSTNNDPLFLFQRWQANLRILEIEKIKSIPRTPINHLCIERLIRTTRNEYLDQILFFNRYDLQKNSMTIKNTTRAHSSLKIKTPNEQSDSTNSDKKTYSINPYCWVTHCRGLYQFPLAI
ncbi:hypothetical protein JYU12_00830 [bacterium AH-315-K03]|nr:hypothetical protein [bacterium AH-315-K03]